MTVGVAIYGTGAYTPRRTLTNADFAKTLDTSDEWITTRTGIKERRIAAPEEATSDLCLQAAQAALADAGMTAEELDLIIVGTVSPDHIFPSASCHLQQKLGLGARPVPAFDMSAACAGFCYGMATAYAYISSGLAKKVLLVGADMLSRLLDYKDRNTCILFGDGAGAVVLGPARTSGASHAVLSTRIYSDGRGYDLIGVPAGGSARPASKVTVEERQHYVHVAGREVFRFGVTCAVDMINDAMQRHNLKPEDIGAIIPHQANIRIIESAADRLDLPLSLFVVNISKYGNTSAASVPIALDEAARAGRLPAGKPVIMLAFGGGLTWASAVVQWWLGGNRR